MTADARKIVLRLLVAGASIESRLDPTILSVHGISLREMILLLNLERAPMHRMRRVDLASAMNIGASSVSHLGDPLEKQGLVKREFDSRDARVAYMTLTDLGLERVRQAEKTLDQLSDKLFDERWAKHDLTEFMKRLGQLVYGSSSLLID